MEVLESFVSNVSLSDVFEVRIGNEPPFKAKCAIKFVFLIIYANESTKIIFIPDYSPAISFGSKKSGQILMLTPIYDEINSLIFLESEESTSIDAFFNLSAGAILALDKFYQLFTDFIQIKRHLISFIPPKMERPIHLVLEKDQVLFDDNEIIVYTYQITKRLQFHILDNINDEFSRIKLINYNGDNIRLQLFSEKDVLILFLALLVNKYIATEEINSKITKLHSSLSVDGLNEPLTEEKENKIGSLETKVKINTKHSLKEQKQEEYIQITNKTTIDNGSEKNDKIIQDLKSKLTNYKRKFYTSQDKEPIIEKTFTIDEKNKKFFIPENSNFIKSPQNIVDLCNSRLKNPYANLSHYFPNPKNYPILFIPDLSFNPNDPHNFLNAYNSADPVTSFRMLVGMIINNFTGKSLAETYGLQTKFKNINEEACTVVSNMGGQLPFFILDNPSIKSFYRRSSMIHDDNLLRSLPYKEVSIIEKCIPLYNFSYNPISEFREVIFDALHCLRTNKLNAIDFFKDFARIWLDILENHVKSYAEMFLLEISNEIRTGEKWSIFTSQNLTFSDKWNLFLLNSISDDEIESNLLNILKHPDTIKKHYFGCAQIRNESVIKEIIVFTHIFQEFHLKISKEDIVKEEVHEKSITDLYLYYC